MTISSVPGWTYPERLRIQTGSLYVIDKNYF